MDKLEKKYSKMFHKFNKYQHDTEDQHIVQDKIYRKFVKDIAKKKLTKIEDIIRIANNINEIIVKKDKDRWYA